MGKSSFSNQDSSPDRGRLPLEWGDQRLLVPLHSPMNEAKCYEGGGGLGHTPGLQRPRWGGGAARTETSTGSGDLEANAVSKHLLWLNCVTQKKTCCRPIPGAYDWTLLGNKFFAGVTKMG